MEDNKKLEYWLRYFGMPEENIENCMTQIVQGYGACRYLDGVSDGADAVNELSKEEPASEDVDLEILCYWRNELTTEDVVSINRENFADIARHFANWQKQQTGFVRGYRKALEDAWEFFGKGFPNDCRILVKQFFDKEMEQKLKELSQG